MDRDTQIKHLEALKSNVQKPKDKKKIVDDLRRKEHVNGRNRIPARA